MDFILGSQLALPFEAARVILALAGTAIGAYFDLANDKNIPNWFLYGFLAIAFIANLAAYDSVLTWYGVISAAAVFAIMYLLYKIGQLGGADAFVVAAIILLIPVQPTLLLLKGAQQYAELPFAFYLIVSSGISFMLYMLAKSIPLAIRAIGTKGAIPGQAWVGSSAIVLAYAIFAFMASGIPYFSQSYLSFITIVVALVVYFTLFKHALNRSMMQWVPPKKVEAEEIIELELIDKKDIAALSLGRLVDSQMQARIAKSSMKKVPVYRGLPPFLPHMFIGLALSLLFGNVIMWLAGSPFAY